MDPSLYHAFYEMEDRHWWFVGRRRIVESLLADALGSDPQSSATSGPGQAPPTSGPGGQVSAVSGPAGVAASPTSGRQLPPARRILDVGCGTGGMLPLLSRFGQVTGIDSEPLALEYCRKRGIADVHLQEGFESSHVFDVVTLFDVIEHVPDEAPFLDRLAGFMKPGGLLVVTVPAFEFLWSRHDDLNHHQRRYTRRRLVDVLERAGFQVQRSSYFNMLLFPAAAAVRLVSGGGRGGAGRAASRNERAVGTAGGAASASDRPSDDGAEALQQLRIGGSNRLLASIFGSERHLLRHMNLPFGVSLYAVARLRSKG